VPVYAVTVRPDVSFAVTVNDATAATTDVARPETSKLAASGGGGGGAVCDEQAATVSRDMNRNQHWDVVIGRRLNGARSLPFQEAE